MKKDKGSIVSIVPVIFAIVGVAIMLLFYIGWMENVSKKDEARQIGRKYILMMESKGYLDGTMESSLRAELATVGVSNISLSGTTTSDAGYGHSIVLNISGDLAIKDYQMGSSIFQLIGSPGTIPISLKFQSTAKN